MKRYLLLASICAAGLIGSLPVVAQQSSSSSAPQSGSSTAQTPSATSQYVRLSQLIGSNAKAKDGQNLDQIEDVVVNPQARQIKFAVLGKGGFLGIGEKMVPVPWKAVSLEQTETGASSKPSLTVNIDRQKLQSAPTLHKDKQYSELDQPDYVITVYRFYEIEPVAAGAPGQGSETQGSSQQGSTSDQPAQQK